MQDAQELNDPEKVSAAWDEHLYELVDKLNDTETQMIGMKPKEAIKLNKVPPVNRENYPPEDTLPEDGLCCYLFQLGEEHDDQSKRAMEYKECPLKRPLSGRVVRSFEIQEAKATNGRKNGSAEESTIFL